MNKFSVLVSIYHKEKAEFFNRAMRSIWDEQDIKPNQIVLVQDGKLNDDLYSVVDKWKIKLDGVLQIVNLKNNIGLGDALNAGMQQCTNNLIARMDTDDISLPNRFKEQLKIFENSDIDICSSWVGEFKYNENDIISHRKVPQHHNEIARFMKTRSGVNHPAVMYKKSAVLKAGGYQRMMWLEDYYLWSRMILSGAKFYNIQGSLLNMRIGNQLERRRGIDYAKSEINLQKRFLKLGFITFGEFVRNVFLRVSARVVPRVWIKKIYKILREK